MGTRSLTVFKEGDDSEIVVMYRQYDGYIEGHGKDLAEFLNRITLVNGIPVGSDAVMANGMGCLAAQVVAHFKDGAGGFYLHAAGTRNCGEEYVYFVSPGEQGFRIEVLDVYANRTIFKGSPQELLDSLDKPEEEVG